MAQQGQATRQFNEASKVRLGELEADSAGSASIAPQRALRKGPSLGAERKDELPKVGLGNLEPERDGAGPTFALRRLSNGTLPLEIEIEEDDFDDSSDSELSESFERDISNTDAELEVGELELEAAERTLFKRHLCVMCPVGSSVLSAGSEVDYGKYPVYCCPKRKTVTTVRRRTRYKTRTVRKTKTKTLTVQNLVGVLFWLGG